mgnify:CR=1 FL=1
MGAVYIWPLGRGRCDWRFQTADSGIARSLRRTSNWTLVSRGINTRHWIFQKSFGNPQKARSKLRSLTRTSKIQKDFATGGFLAEINPNTTSEKESLHG